MKVLSLLLCLILVQGLSGFGRTVSKVFTFDDVIGDTTEDCIVTRKLFDPEVCKRRGPYRSIDGTCNNLQNPIQGASFTVVERLIKPHYARKNDIPIGFPYFSKFSKIRAKVETGKPCNIKLPFNKASFRKTISPSAQEVSDSIFQVASDSIRTKNKVSHMFMTFGQFIDHDLVIVRNENQQCQNPNCENLSAFKYPCNPIIRNTNLRNQKVQCSSFARSRAACNTKSGYREQVNELTSYIDGSMIYGNTQDELRRVRTENGLLRTSEGDLLPFDPNPVFPCVTRCFLAGDIRTNNNIALMAMHVVWLRLHNIIANELKIVNKYWDSNRIFEETRQIIIAILQNIVYEEFVPLMVDIPPYRGYNPRVSAAVSNAFATAAYRVGHSLVRNSFDQLDRNFQVVRPAVPLQNAFTNIEPILKNGIEETMYGLLGNDTQPADTTFAEGLAEKLFVSPNNTRGFRNLAALNIQRGRDHGIPSYTAVRKYCRIGNSPIRYFSQFRREIRKKSSLKALRKLYRSVRNHIDLYPAGVAETPVRGKLVGPTFGCLIGKQFQNARDGDRFYFENIFSWSKIREVKKMTLAKVLCLTLKDVVSVQGNVFRRFMPGITRRKACDVRNKDKYIDLRRWSVSKRYHG